MAVAIGDVEIASCVELQLVGHVQGRCQGRTAVSAVAALAASRNGRHALRRKIEPPHPLAIHLTEVQRTVRTNGEAKRGGGLPIVVTRDAGAEHRVNRLVRAQKRGPEEHHGSGDG